MKLQILKYEIRAVAISKVRTQEKEGEDGEITEF